MSDDLKAVQRFQYQGRPYIVVVYHDGELVSGYKIKREGGSDQPTPRAFHFDASMSGPFPYLPERDAWDMDLIPGLLADYEARLLAAPAQLKLEAKSGSLRISLEAEDTEVTQTDYNSDLLMHALTFLIEYADVEEWQGSPGEIEPERFWSSLLESIAVSYNFSLELPYRNTTYQRVLNALIDDLVEKGYMGEMVESDEEGTDQDD